jgi:hypothetical protein
LEGNGVLTLRDGFLIDGDTKLFGRYNLGFIFLSPSLVAFKFENELGSGSRMFNVISNTDKALYLQEASEKKLTIHFTNNPVTGLKNRLAIEFIGIPLPGGGTNASVKLSFK